MDALVSSHRRRIYGTTSTEHKVVIIIIIISSSSKAIEAITHAHFQIAEFKSRRKINESKN